MSTITQYEAIAKIQRMFAFYGHVRCPLNNNEILTLWSDYSDDEIYSIGCDVAAGFPLNEAIEALGA